MRHPAALLFTFVVALVCRASAAAPVSPPPSDWIDPQTGHRVIRLSPDTGGTSLYFHQRAYTPEGDKLVLRGAGGISTVDLKTLGVSSPKSEIVLAGANPIATAWRTREAYYVDRQLGAMMAVHLDTKAVREVVKLPPQARSGAYALNCDESLLVGIAPDPDGKTTPREPPPGNPAGSTLEPRWKTGAPQMLYTLNVKSGELKVIHRENDWTNHLQCSPTDPQQILFCHEGPWHYNDRTWTIRADGGPAKLLHERTMNMEIEGHEFFGHDGKWVWYDLQTPMSGVFWLAGVEIATGKRVWYNLQRAEWSVHYNISPDGTFFSGDGGGPTSVAARTMDREDIQGQGQWMYLFHPVMTTGSSFRDGKPLIDAGYFKSERLVDMSKHDYSKTTGVEPNGTFTPDGKWLVFSGNFHSPRDAAGKAVTHTYAVEIAKPAKKS